MIGFDCKIATFQTPIFDMFFTSHSWDKCANQRLKHLSFDFRVKMSSQIFELYAKRGTIRHNTFDIDDKDADWLLGGAQAGHTRIGEAEFLQMPGRGVSLLSRVNECISRQVTLANWCVSEAWFFLC